MKKIFIIILVIWGQFGLVAQTEVTAPQLVEFPRFFFDILNFYSFNEKQSRLDIFIQVPFKNLQFVKESNKFIASYEIIIDVFNSNNQLEVEKSFTKEIPLLEFSETISKQNYDLSQKSFNLKPGKYHVEILLTDNDSRKSFKIKKDVEVRDYASKKAGLSDLMLVSKINEINGKRSMVPNVSGNVGNLPTGFHVFFELYTSDIINDSVKIDFGIFGKNDKLISENSIHQFSSDHITPVFLSLSNENLIFGDYKLIVKITSPKYPDIFEKVSLGRFFIVRWQDMPVSVNDLNLAILQMRYIAQQKEVDSISEAKSDKEKQKRFLEFWKNRKPSMEEYYARVDYSNEHFKTHKDGWKTDMGMVFIIFGVPDNIDRHPFDLGNAPYEIWDYYNLNRRFIFVDEAGFGEYRLLNPVWDKNERVY